MPNTKHQRASPGVSQGRRPKFSEFLPHRFRGGLVFKTHGLLYHSYTFVSPPSPGTKQGRRPSSSQSSSRHTSSAPSRSSPLQGEDATFYNILMQPNIGQQHLALPNPQKTPFGSGGGGGRGVVPCLLIPRGLSLEIQGQNLAETVLSVPYWLVRGSQPLESDRDRRSLSSGSSDRRSLQVHGRYPALRQGRPRWLHPLGRRVSSVL